MMGAGMFPPKRYITSAMLITDHWFRLVIANADRRRERGARGRELSPFFYLSEVEHLTQLLELQACAFVISIFAFDIYPFDLPFLSFSLTLSYSLLIQRHAVLATRSH
jgi:hypothetical protein